MCTAVLSVCVFCVYVGPPGELYNIKLYFYQTPQVSQQLVTHSAPH